ncbi:hypothetical protein JCM10212_004958 [Sporobolomyces blumeae]
MEPSFEFRPRQSSYLRISPTLVLQLVLYLEPHHVAWMNASVFERMLVALKDRIPLKLQQEDVLGRAKKHQRQRDKVDVFRGADYQMAFFFRKTTDKHVVLLKEKHLHYTTRSVPRKRQRSPSLPRPPRHETHPEPTDDERDPALVRDDRSTPDGPVPHPHSKPLRNAHDPASRGEAASGLEDNDAARNGSTARRRRRSEKAVLPRGSDDSAMPLTRDEEVADAGPGPAERGSERRRVDEARERGGGGGGAAERGREPDGLVAVKDEPVDEDPLMVLSEARPIENRGLFRPEPDEDEREERAAEQEDDGEEVMEDEVDEDVKPQLKVNYQKFTIFDRSLVVIVEPYPALPISSLTTPAPSLLNTEIRQLSASVDPESYARSSSSTPYPSSFPRSGDLPRGRSSSVMSSTAASTRAASLSVTPAPASIGSRRKGGALFRRSDTTPLESPGPPSVGPLDGENGRRRSTGRRGPDDDEHGVDLDEDDDEQMRGFREMSEFFAGAEDWGREFRQREEELEDERRTRTDERDKEDAEDELLSVDELLSRRDKRGRE